MVNSSIQGAKPAIPKIPRLLLLAALAAMTLGADDQGCESQSSASVDADTVHAAYWLYYDSDRDITFARAQFRFGSPVGTTLILEEPAQVSFNGAPMAFNALLDWHEIEMAGRIDGGEFRYLDVEGDEFTNTAPGYRESQVLSVPAAIDSNESFELRWSGGALVENELLETVVARDNNRLDFIRVDQRGIGATSVVLPADRLQTLGRGEAVISVRRHRDLPLTDATSAGGKITVTFQAPDRLTRIE
ncbi:MAG: hypothetical protein AAFQ65_13085 [Myxococcota bacterium]